MPTHNQKLSPTMTPEEIAGLFLDCQKNFPDNNRLKQALDAILSDTSFDSENRNYKIAASSIGQLNVIHNCYRNAIAQYRDLSKAQRDAVQPFIRNMNNHKTLIQKAKERIYAENPDLKPTAAPTVEIQAQHPQKTEPEATPTPPTFKTMFENVSFEQAYRDLQKLSFAKKLHVHNYLREEQIQLLDQIEKALLSDNKASDAEHAQIFHSILNMMHHNLEKEFRWTSLIGFPKTSRLDDVIQTHIKDLSTGFPDITPLVDKAPLKALLTKKGLGEIEKQIDTLLKPQGFLEAAMAFIKHGFSVFQKPTPKP